MCLFLVPEFIEDIIEHGFGVGPENGTENLLFADMVHIWEFYGSKIFEKYKVGVGFFLGELFQEGNRPPKFKPLWENQ
jgi:hypothetical protein